MNNNLETLNKSNDYVDNSTKKFVNSYHEFVAGYLAACTSICVLFPLNKIIFRQQLHAIDANVACKQLYSEGLTKLYRGM